MSARGKYAIDLGEILAERSFYLEPDGAVTVRIGFPINPPDYPDESWCPYQVEGLGNAKVRPAIGIDHFQSILLAMQMVGTTLYSSPEFKAGRLRFAEDSAAGDLGMPVLEGMRHLLPPWPPPRPEGTPDPA